MPFTVGDLVVYRSLPIDNRQLTILGRIESFDFGVMFVDVISQFGELKFISKQFTQDLSDLRRITKMESLNG